MTNLNITVLATTEFLSKMDDGTYIPNYWGNRLKLIAEVKTMEPPFQYMRFESKNVWEFKYLSSQIFGDFRSKCLEQAAKLFKENKGTPNTDYPCQSVIID